MERSNLEKMKIKTRNIMLLWKNAKGIADNQIVEKMDVAMLDWIVELTNCLDIWLNKGENMTIGELILARVNMGALVESWLKFFYSVHYTDYLKGPLYDKKNNRIEPEDITFEMLKQFGVGKLWDTAKDCEYKWVEKTQHMRNVVHAFKYKDIGTSNDFLEDVEKYCIFVDNIDMALPPLEDWVETLPEGYIANVNFE